MTGKYILGQVGILSLFFKTDFLQLRANNTHLLQRC